MKGPDESADGWVAAGAAYDVPNDDQWHTKTWILENTRLVGKWGYHFDFDSNLPDESAYCVRSAGSGDDVMSKKRLISG